MSAARSNHYTAFEGTRRAAAGSLVEVALALRARTGAAAVLVFDDATGRPVDLDLRGTAEEVRARVGALEAPSGKSRGRPRLGVIAKEITLLPRHWAWLAAQRGGASATLRRLVDQARKAGEHTERARRAQDATFRFTNAVAGDLPGFEESVRALFAGDAAKFAAETEAWPSDVRAHARTLAADAFRGTTPDGSSG